MLFARSQHVGPQALIRNTFQPPVVLVAGTERETAERVEKATEGLVEAVKFVSDQMNDVTVQIEEFNRKLEDSRRVMVSKVSIGRRSRSITFDDKIRIIDMAELQADGAGMRNLEPKNYSQRWNLFNKSNAFQRFKSERSKWFKDDPNKFLDPRKGEVVSRS